MSDIIHSALVKKVIFQQNNYVFFTNCVFKLGYKRIEQFPFIQNKSRRHYKIEYI